MTGNLALQTFRIFLAAIAAPWALVVAAFILAICGAAQALSVSAGVGVYAATRRRPPYCTMVADVAYPRIAEMWRDWLALWRPSRAA